MKKLFTSVFIFFAVFSLTGCSSPMKSTEKCPNNLSSPFSADMVLALDKLNAEGKISRLGDGEWEVEFESPNTLSGVCMKFSSGNVTASYKGLNFSVPRSALPAKAMLLNLIDAVDTNARSEELKGASNEGMLEISGSLECGDYVITVDDKGYIHSFSMPNNLLKIAFSDVDVHSAPQIAPETAVTEMIGTTSPAETECTTSADIETAADEDTQAADEVIVIQQENSNLEED